MRVLACVLVRCAVAFAASWGLVHSAETTSTSTAPGAETAAPLPALVQAPYLQSVSATSVVVLWRTREPAHGWVEFGPTPSLGHTQYASVHGLRAAKVTDHRVVLAGLQPGTSYWYQVAFKPIRNFGAYKVEFGRTERSQPVRFQMLPGPRQPVSAIVFNDLHNETALFQRLRRSLGDRPFDFSIFNGDCFADPTNAPKVLPLLAAYTQGVEADARPVFFLRGNHETRGAYARELPAHFAWPGDQPYFAFSAGPVRFVLLDCGEDKPDEHAAYSGLVDFAAFRRAETEWLKAEVASKAYRQAAWRVLVHHIPLYRARSPGSLTNASPKAGATSPKSGAPLRVSANADATRPAALTNAPSVTGPPLWQETWRKLLRKVDVALCGHTHSRAFLPAGSVGNPYPVFIGGGPKTNTATVMMLDAGRRELTLRVVDAYGLDVFEPMTLRR